MTCHPDARPVVQLGMVLVVVNVTVAAWFARAGRWVELACVAIATLMAAGCLAWVRFQRTEPPEDHAALPPDPLARRFVFWCFLFGIGTILHLTVAACLLAAKQWPPLPLVATSQTWLTVARINSMTLWERDVELKLLRDLLAAKQR